jgi:hypothetical protein
LESLSLHVRQEQAVDLIFSPSLARIRHLTLTSGSRWLDGSPVEALLNTPFLEHIVSLRLHNHDLTRSDQRHLRVRFGKRVSL